MKTPSIDEIINYEDLSTDKPLGTLAASDGTPLAELRWSGKYQQLELKALYGASRDGTALQVTFDGHLSTPDIPRRNLNAPSAGRYMSFVEGQVFYFKDEAEMSTDNRYSINQNHAFLDLDDCTLNLADYSEGVSFDLRCDFHGVPASGLGYVKVLLSIVQDNTDSRDERTPKD